MTKMGGTLTECLIFLANTQEENHEVVDDEDSSESKASVLEFLNDEKMLRLLRL